MVDPSAIIATDADAPASPIIVDESEENLYFEVLSGSVCEVPLVDNDGMPVEAD